jgi:hypothetical protein
VKTIGDEVMCRFKHADQAVRAACSIHEALEWGERFDGEALAAHVGLHFGPAFLADNDVHGDAVNVAASMATIAKPRQAITTQDTITRLSPEVAALTRLYDVVSLKGNRREIAIYEVLWEKEDVTAILMRASSEYRSAAPSMSLSYHANEMTVTPDTPVLLMGRGSDCDLVVEASLVSRVHAKIEYRRGKFVLIDQSTNGTFVRPRDGKEVYLRREEMPLLGSGHISLGKATRQGEADVIYYSAQ